MLHRGGLKAPADFLKQRIPCFSFIAEYLDFNQFVASERLIQFMNDIFGQARLTYPDNRGDRVSKCSEGAPTNECER